MSVSQVLLFNSKAAHQYELLEKYEAGMVLTGAEVKSLRQKKGSLHGSYVKIIAGEAFLVGAHIHPYFYSHTQEEVDPLRTRKLLLHRREVERLEQLVKTQGRTLVPVSIQLNHRRVKLVFAVGKGKKIHEKRAELRERDQRRTAEREVKEKLRWK